MREAKEDLHACFLKIWLVSNVEGTYFRLPYVSTHANFSYYECNELCLVKVCFIGGADEISSYNM